MSHSALATLGEHAREAQDPDRVLVFDGARSLSDLSAAALDFFATGFEGDVATADAAFRNVMWALYYMQLIAGHHACVQLQNQAEALHQARSSHRSSFF